MTDHDRRLFIKQSASLFSALAVTRCAPADAGVAEGASRDLKTDTLRAIAQTVLPSELGAAGQTRVVEDFQRWLAEYEPVPELTHPYGSAEIRYGPPDPAPRWRSQLEALDLESGKRFGTSFAEVPREEREGLVRREVAAEGPGMPDPLRAQHVAVALMSYYFGSPEANDLCYRAEIGAYRCRGLQSAVTEPSPLRERA